jgi:hypothetical protein
MKRERFVFRHRIMIDEELSLPRKTLKTLRAVPRRLKIALCRFSLESVE